MSSFVLFFISEEKRREEKRREEKRREETRREEKRREEKRSLQSFPELVAIERSLYGSYVRKQVSQSMVHIFLQDRNLLSFIQCNFSCSCIFFLLVLCLQPKAEELRGQVHGEVASRGLDKSTKTTGLLE
jgi:hypothetical protein